MDQPGSTTSQGNSQPTEIATKASSSHSEADADRGPALLATQDPAVVPNFDGDSQSLQNDLELLLQCSRPYSRLQLPFEKLLLSSASHYTGLDTVMTGISLSAVSNLSLVSLPISIHEIWNKTHYTAIANPQCFSPHGRNQSHAAPNIRDSSTSRSSQDNERTSASSETSVRCSSDTHRSFDRVNALPIEQAQDLVKPRRKIVIHGMFDV